MSGPSFFDRFFTRSLELMATADTNGYFRHLNPAWEQVLGYPLEELKSRPFLDFVHPDDIDSTCEQVQQRVFPGPAFGAAASSRSSRYPSLLPPGAALERRHRS